MRSRLNTAQALERIRAELTRAIRRRRLPGRLRRDGAARRHQGAAGPAAAARRGGERGGAEPKPWPNATPLRVGVVGTGALGRHHVRHPLRRSPAPSWWGSTTRGRRRREAVAREHGAGSFADARRRWPARSRPRWSPCPPSAHAEIGVRAARARPPRAGREADRRHAWPRPTRCSTAASAAAGSSRSGTSSSTTRRCRRCSRVGVAAALRRGAAPGGVHAAQPRRRRGARPDDPRPPDPPRPGPEPGRRGAGDRHRRAVAADRHRQRPGRARLGLRGQPDRLAGLRASGCASCAPSCRSRYYSLDYQAQEIRGYRLERRRASAAIVPRRPAVERREPLRRELEAFVAACRGEAAPLVDGAARRRALATAIDVAARAGDAARAWRRAPVVSECGSARRRRLATTLSRPSQRRQP